MLYSSLLSRVASTPKFGCNELCLLCILHGQINLVVYSVSRDSNTVHPNLFIKFVHDFTLHPFRVKYALLKEECREMFPLVGMGKFVTAPIITEDGEPVREPIVLQQINLEDEPAPLTNLDGTKGNSADPYSI